MHKFHPRKNKGGGFRKSSGCDLRGTAYQTNQKISNASLKYGKKEL